MIGVIGKYGGVWCSGDLDDECVFALDPWTSLEFYNLRAHHTLIAYVWMLCKRKLGFVK